MTDGELLCGFLVMTLYVSAEMTGIGEQEQPRQVLAGSGIRDPEPLFHLEHEAERAADKKSRP